MEAVLRTFARKYPGMQPVDVIKLLYQREMGGGHLVRDREESLKRILEECRPDLIVETEPEALGGNMFRVHLSSLPALETPEQLNVDFVRSSARHRGRISQLEKDLTEAEAMADAGLFPAFDGNAMRRAHADFREKGYPIPSHSPEYRRLYRPAYRVVDRCCSFPLMIREALERSRENLTILALDGRCGSGKSTLARALSRKYGWTVVSMDDFFLRPEQRTETRYAMAGGNVDAERVLEEVLKPLREGGEVKYRPFDCRTMGFQEERPVPVTSVVILEGTYACHPMLWSFSDLHVFLDIDPVRQMERILRRNGERAEDFRTRWIPLEEHYFRETGVEYLCEYALEPAEAEHGEKREENS